MTKPYLSAKSSKDFSEAQNHAVEIANFIQSASKNGIKQAAIDKLTEECQSAVETGTRRAFIAGAAASIVTPVGPEAILLLSVEGTVIVKAVGQASENVCRDISTLAVDKLDTELTDLGDFANKQALKIVAPNAQVISDYNSMINSAQIGDVSSTEQFAAALNQDFGLPNLNQMQNGDFLLSESGAYELFNPQMQPISIMNNNSDGTSDLITYGPQGGYADAAFSGKGASGTKTAIDVERGNNTSTSVTFDGDGNPNVVNYSGPGFTGDVQSQNGGQASNTNDGSTSGSMQSFVYQGNGLSPINSDAVSALLAGTGPVTANATIANLPDNFSGSVSTDINSNNLPYIYYASMDAIGVNGGVHNDEQATGYIDFSNGVITSWSLETDPSGIYESTTSTKDTIAQGSDAGISNVRGKWSMA